MSRRIADPDEKLMPAKKSASPPADDLRPEYDIPTLGEGVRGKYCERASSGTTIVRLDSDLAAAFRPIESGEHHAPDAARHR